MAPCMVGRQHENGVTDQASRSLLQVIDLISLKPFDLEAITKSIKKTRKCIIVEECMKTGGIGASLSAVINESLFNELDHEVRWAHGYLFPGLAM